MRSTAVLQSEIRTKKEKIYFNSISATGLLYCLRQIISSLLSQYLYLYNRNNTCITGCYVDDYLTCAKSFEDILC